MMKTLLADDKLADDKLAAINQKIKAIYTNIKAKETEKADAVVAVKAATAKLDSHKRKVTVLSEKALELLKGQETITKEIEKGIVILNGAELSKKI